MSEKTAKCYEESESVRIIPNRPVELEIRMAEEFWGSWVDQPVGVIMDFSRFQREKSIIARLEI